jgi:uncharacterized protein with HEPN domain
MSPDDLIRMRHMAEAARAAIGFCRGRDRHELDSDTMLRMALLHVVQIIGEAAARVSDAGRSAAPGVEWAVIVAMRNRLVHAYFDVNTDILWKTVVISLPVLLQQLEAVAGAEPPDTQED